MLGRRLLIERAAEQLRRRLSRPRPLRDKQGPFDLRVMTYNTHHGADRNDRHDLEAIAQTIEACGPDVVALQEVDRNWGSRSARLDQPAWYADRLGLQMHYAPNVVREGAEPGEPPGEYGLALLTRLPLTSPDHRLYRGSAGETRGLVTGLVTVQTPSNPSRTVRVINTHLSVRNRAARRLEIDQLLSYADSEQDLPTVVAGDFNALTRARALRAMRSTYRDAWDVGRGSPSTVPGRRIDYLWMSEHLRPLQTVVIRSAASDHFALVSDLTWS